MVRTQFGESSSGFHSPQAWSSADAVVVQPDGKIVAAGTTQSEDNYDQDFVVARYEFDGSLDDTFGDGGRVVTSFGPWGEGVSAVLLRPNGHILAVGDAQNRSGGYSDGYLALAQYEPDGSPDMSFGKDGQATYDRYGSERARAAQLQPDGKILVAGGRDEMTVMRFLPDGSPDLSFGEDGLVDFSIDLGVRDAKDIELLGDGKMLVATTVGHTRSKFGAARLAQNGTLDPCFGTDGRTTTGFHVGRITGSLGGYAEAMVAQGDGKIVVGGRAINGGSEEFAFARYHADGAPDETFGQGGKVQIDLGDDEWLHALLLQADGKLVGVGRRTIVGYHSFTVFRLETNGELDPTFGTGGQLELPESLPTFRPHAAALTPDGNVVVAGYGDAMFIVARVLSDSPPFTGPLPPAEGECPTPAAPRLDFNGDGRGDIAVGIPGEDRGELRDSGAVTIFSAWAAFGTPLDEESEKVPGVAEAGDRFGASLAGGDFDADGNSDLAIGVPGEGIGTIARAGAVDVLYGDRYSFWGPGRSQNWHQNSTGVPGVSELNDGFGTSLVAGDFNEDGFDDLAVGVPGEGVGRISRAGAVNVLFGSAAGLNSSRAQIGTQDKSPPEKDDRFGASLAAGDFNADGRDDLAIGVPGEGVGPIAGAGAVSIMAGSSSGLRKPHQLWHQDVPKIADKAEQGDRFGSSLAAADFNGDGRFDLGIGAPWESVGAASRAGVAHVLFGSTAGLQGDLSQLWHQNSLAIPDFSESNDTFGFALSANDLNGDSKADLVIGIPGESLNGLRDAGAVSVLYGSSSGVGSAGTQFWHQGVPGNMEPGGSEAGDRFGHAVAATPLGYDRVADLLVGIPSEDNTGAVTFMPGTRWGVTNEDEIFVRGEPTWEHAGVYAEPGDRFGASFSSAADTT